MNKQELEVMLLRAAVDGAKIFKRGEIVTAVDIEAESIAIHTKQAVYDIFMRNGKPVKRTVRTHKYSGERTNL